MRIAAAVAFCVLFFAAGASAQEFAGSTPCGPIARRFLNIPASAACERITWQVRFSADQFEIDATYGMQAVNAPGFAPGSAVTSARGSVTRGPALASYSASETFRFTSTNRGVLTFALIDGVLLHPLDARGELLRGDAGWSYTLTRATPLETAPRKLRSPSAARTSAAEDFEGRTPCAEILLMLRLTATGDCEKLKWALTLMPDGTYKLDGTLYRNAPRSGAWTVRVDEVTGALVYVLYSGQPSALSLLKAGPDVLFFLDGNGAVLRGNASHSYTLNRSAR